MSILLNHKKGTYETNNISLLCLDNKIYTQNNGFYELALG